MSLERAAGRSWWVAVWVWAVAALGCATVPQGPGAEGTYSHRRGVAGEDTSRRPRVKHSRRHAAPASGTEVPYRRARLTELEQRRAAEGPLRWEGYERMRGLFARGLAFEHSMVSLLRADAALPQAQRRWLRDFHQPRIEVHVGVSKPGKAGIRYADVLILEERPAAGQPPRVETFSFKSRNLAPLKPDPLSEQIRMDAHAALEYYGGTLDILRPAIKRRAQVQRVRLVYEGGGFKPTDPQSLMRALRGAKQSVAGVEVLFQ